jgi:hypothetical protein
MFGGIGPGGISLMFSQNTINMIGIFMILIPAEFILDKKKYQYTAGKTDGQTGDVDQGIAFLLFYVS